MPVIGAMAAVPLLLPTPGIVERRDKGRATCRFLAAEAARNDTAHGASTRGGKFPPYRKGRDKKRATRANSVSPILIHHSGVEFLRSMRRRNMKNPARRIFEELWNNKNRAVIDELMSPDYVHHDPQAADIPPGIDGYKQFVERYMNAFPDTHMTVEDEIVAGDTVVVRWTVTGTHRGELPGLPPTGRKISLSGISIARLREGKFVESWNNWDALGMMQQLSSATGKAA
jgi:steroid delta-isomerase-like uncharacterized protein